MILEALCRGNLSPVEQLCPEDPDYRKANEAVCKLLEALSRKLSKEDYRLVTDLMSQSAAAQCLENEEYFKVGYALGAAIEREVMETLKFIVTK